MLRVFALSTILMSLCCTADAGTVQTVRFAQTGKVLVWIDGEMVGQGAAVSLSADKASSEPVYGNGSLEPAGSFSTEAPHRLIISVASNTGFVLETDTPRDRGEISVRVLEAGENARALTRRPANGSRQIFEQTDRTAHGRGAPLSQSLTLEVISTGRVLDDITVKATTS